MTDTPKEAIARAMAELGLTVAAEFVPWSQSRNKDERVRDYSGKPTDRPQRSLNWRITVKHNGRDVLATDYGAGIAHCPGYRQNDRSISQAELIEFETETGYPGHVTGGGSVIRKDSPARAKRIEPDPVDVIASLVMDSSVLDSGGFEDWASDLGYDIDSRKAEAVYRACLEIALKLRAAIGEDGLAKLRAATDGY